MPLFRTIAYFTGSVAFAGAMSGARPALRANTFFGCEPGFAFEASAESARCRRPASVVVASMTDCPSVGGAALAERVDLAGVRDVCASATPPSGTDVSVERTCPPSYTKRVVPGRDRCEMASPEMIRAPSVPVAR